jgi:regulator of protease activity HflC (stomatin/prohibitin superfamily)
MKDQKLTTRELYTMIISFSTIVITLSLIGLSVGYVDVGHAAVIVDPLFGNPATSRISGIMTGAAWFFKPPWANVLDIYYATDSYEDVIPCFSSDQLEMAITVQMRWQLNTSRLVELYRSYPKLDYESTAIDPIMEETIRLVTKNYTALETIEFRDIIAVQMEQAIFSKIHAEASLENALSYLTFDLKNIGYPEQYTAAIEDKLVKEQQRLGAEFDREKILILANATAQEIVIKADAEAQAKIIVANSTRQGIELILQASGADPTNSTRIAELYLWVETLRQIAPNIDLFLVSTGQDGIPILVPMNQTGG